MYSLFFILASIESFFVNFLFLFFRCLIPFIIVLLCFFWFIFVFLAFLMLIFSLSFSLSSNSSKISSAVVTNFAIPSFIRLFVPVPQLLYISCGIANIFFPCSFASLAVTLVPLLCFASIINTPIDIPLTILFLCKNFLELASSFGLYSVIISPPFFIISLYNHIFSLGYILFNPFPNTAIVFPLFSSVSICAAVSIPFC